MPLSEPIEIDEAPDERDSPHALPFPVVGIGTAARGLEACTELLGKLPSDTGMAFVVVSHLSGEQAEHVVTNLTRRAAMPVELIQPEMAVQRNHVYVAPPEARVTMSQGRLQLQPGQSDDRTPLTVDPFLRSLGADQKNRAIGILLSGEGADGALGLKTVKGEGGIAIVQDPRLARYGELPRGGVPADHVDLVLDLPQIAAELARLARQFGEPQLAQLESGALPVGDEHYFSRILGIIRNNSGLDPSHYKPSIIRRRLARRMMLQRIDTLSEYARYLQSNFQEVRELHEDVLISVTRFFRNPEVYEALTKTILPRLFENRPPEQQIRVWVAGCSSGEEAYSIAMCLLEHVASFTLEQPIQIFGTDTSERAIKRARAAQYPESIAADISPERLRRFFVKTKQGYEVSKRVRDLCIFARQNPISDPPFSRLDLITGRNVMIHLNSDVQRRVMAVFHHALRQTGFLLLGNSETSCEHRGLFTAVDRSHGVFAKVSGALAPTTLDLAHGFMSSSELPGMSGEGWDELDLQRAADRIVLARRSPPGVVVNAAMEVIQVRGRVTPYLEMPAGTPSLYLLRMAREGLGPVLGDAIRRAIEADVPVTVEDLSVRHEETVQRFNLEVLPIQALPARERCFLVLFVPYSSDRAGRNEASLLADFAGATPDERDQEILRLRQDLSSTRLSLQSLIEERDARCQGLTRAYEEIQSANQELQSINKELETANGQLQSANQELRDRNAALIQAGNDLNRLLDSVDIPVVMLGSDLTIRHFTPPAERLMHLRGGDIGRPIREIRLNLSIEDIEPLLRDALQTRGAKEVVVQDRQGHWSLLRIRPYCTTENKIEGLLLALLDIDEFRHGEEARREVQDFGRTIVEGVQMPLLVLDQSLRITSANTAFRKLSGLSSEDLEQRSFPEMVNLLWGMERVRTMLESLLEDGKSGVEFEHETEGVSRRILRLHAHSVHRDGAPPLLLIMVEDVTAQRDAELVLVRERERLANQVQITSQALDRTKEELRALAARLFVSQEEERKRVARELHDDISQRLAVLEMDTEEMRKNPPSGAAELNRRLAELRARTAELSEDVRDISHRLHPSILEHLGLTAAVQSLVEEFGAQEKMPASFITRQVPQKIPPNIATALYRITQEALRNVSKHAGKTHVRVSLVAGDDHLRLTVRDMGNGFDPVNARGLGLVSMEERARLVGGAFRVESEPGEGTIVEVEAPLPGKSE